MCVCVCVCVCVLGGLIWFGEKPANDLARIERIADVSIVLRAGQVPSVKVLGGKVRARSLEELGPVLQDAQGELLQRPQWFYREFPECFRKPEWRETEEPMPEHIEVDEFDHDDGRAERSYEEHDER